MHYGFNQNIDDDEFIYKPYKSHMDGTFIRMLFSCWCTFDMVAARPAAGCLWVRFIKIIELKNYVNSISVCVLCMCCFRIRFSGVVLAIEKYDINKLPRRWHFSFHCHESCHSIAITHCNLNIQSWFICSCFFFFPNDVTRKVRGVFTQYMQNHKLVAMNVILSFMKTRYSAKLQKHWSCSCLQHHII